MTGTRHCPKCSADGCMPHYNKQYGREQLIFTCGRCGYQWAEDTDDQREHPYQRKGYHLAGPENGHYPPF